ncbi:MAG: hypothetical protein ACFE96_10950 [Candidatus Hermodarchaeota archaeon]
MVKYRKVISLLLVVFIAMIWSSVPNLWFHVFFVIVLVTVYSLLTGILYMISAQDKKAAKIYQPEEA